MSEKQEKFWAENIQDLFSSFRILPTKDMTPEERLNALTMIILLITLILYSFYYKY